MHIILLTKKKFGVITIILGLMLLLFGLGYTFDGGLKFTALMQNNIYSLKDYNYSKVNFSYKLPSEWRSNIKDFSPSGILYHNEFVSQDSIISGIVEVFNCNEDLKAYLNYSKNFKASNNYCDNFVSTDIKIKNLKGYLISYDLSYTDSPAYTNHDYYIKKGDKLYKLSFSVRRDKFNEGMTAIFDTITNSIKIN